MLKQVLFNGKSIEYVIKARNKVIDDNIKPGSSISEILNQVRFHVPTINRDGIEISHKQVKSGFLVMFHVPFNGDGNIFNYATSPSNDELKTIASVDEPNSELVLDYLLSKQTEEHFLSDLDKITASLERMESNVREFNESAPDLVSVAMADKSRKLDSAMELLESLPYTLRSC